MAVDQDTTKQAALSALGDAVFRVMAAAGLTRAVIDHVPEGAGDYGKLECLDAIELRLLRPAAADLVDAYEETRNAIERNAA
jgi:hypothetical protein